MSIVFEDRKEAGKALGRALLDRKDEFSLVAGLTRGGVPVAYEVAKALELPLDIIVVKKLRSPVSEELAIGAVTADGTHVLHTETADYLGVDRRYVDRELATRREEAAQSERQYRAGYEPPEVAGAAVIVVDDGIATGSSLEAAVRSLRQKGARKIMVATPVGSSGGCNAMRSVADEVFCLTTPVDFWAVGMFYRNFAQTSEAEVRQLLQANREAMSGVGSQ